MGRVRVLHVLNSFEDASISRIVLRLIENLGPRETSWHVGALSRLSGMQNAFERLGARVTHFDGDARGLARSIRSYVQTNAVTVVHTHTPKGILVTALALRRLPAVTHVATKHLLNAPGDRRFGLAYSLIDRLTLYLPDVVIPVSGTMYDQISSQPLIDRSKVVLIRNAIPVDEFGRPHERAAAREELGLPPDAFVAGYAGRIEKVKRIDVMLEAFRDVLAKHPQTRLVIAGDGSLMEELRALAETLHVEHAVTWTGFRDDVPRLLAAIDVYVQSSTNEGLPLSILEAMAAGTAVVATSVGGSTEVIVDGKTGIIVPPGSPAPIARAMLALIEDPERRRLIAQAGRAHVEAEYGLMRMVNRYGAVYASMAASIERSI